MNAALIARLLVWLESDLESGIDDDDARAELVSLIENLNRLLSQKQPKAVAL